MSRIRVMCIIEFNELLSPANTISSFSINTIFNLAGLPEIRVEAYLRAGPALSCW